MVRSNLAIIIPTFNEEKTIGPLIKKLKKYGKIILIDDFSTDNTFSISNKFKIKILRNKKKMNYDKSLNKGFEYAKKKLFQYAMTIDADGEHNPREVSKFIKFLDKNNDLVLGKRNIFGRPAELFASFLSKKFLKISDPFCGLKAYKLSWIKKGEKFDSYNSIGTDLAFRMIRRKAKFIEIPIKIKKRKDKSRFGNYLYSNYKIFRSIILGIFIIK